MPNHISPDKKQSGKCLTIFWIILTLGLSLFYIHNQSFWIDEAISADISRQATLADSWKMIADDNSSDIQMPLYVLYSWGWEKITGTSEILLRASNILFLFIGSFFFRKKPFALLLYLISPLVVYYTGEFRVYAMQIAAGTWVAAELFMKRDDEGKMNLNSFYAGSLFLCLASLQGVVWALGAFCAFAIINMDRLRSPAFWKTTIKWAVPFILLASYYLVVILNGANPTRIVSSVFVNIIQSVYEVAGFTGLGPGRSEARESLSNALPYLPGLIAFAVILAWGLYYSFTRWAKKYGKLHVLALCAAIIVPFIMLSLMSMARDFRFSGRHCTPMFGYFIVVLTSAFTLGRWKDWGRLKQICYLALIAAFAVSSYQVRYSPRFERDDYRYSVKYANERHEEGVPVLWLGVRWSGEYYGINKDSVLSYNESDISLWENAREVIYSRMDIFPEQNKILLRLKGSEYYTDEPLCAGFRVLKRK